MTEYRAPVPTLRHLLQQGVIPCMVVDYTPKSLSILLYKKKNWLLCTYLRDSLGSDLEHFVLTKITNKKVELLLNEVSKIYINDLSYMEQARLNSAIATLLETADNLLDYHEKLSAERFTKKDFDTLTRLGFEARYHPKFWET